MGEVPYDKWSKLELTPGKLRELNQKHTQPEIAVMLGVAEMTVRRWLRKHGIDGLRGYERRVQDSTGPTLADLTADTLRTLYCERLLTDSEIGARYGVSKMPVRHRRHEWGIETISRGERMRLRAPVVVAVPPAPPKVPEARPKVPKPVRRAVCAWEDCENVFVVVARATYCSEDCRRAVAAERARQKRAQKAPVGPIMRTFVCETVTCGHRWKTSEPGNWRLCASCRMKREAGQRRELEKRREKTCAYQDCGKSFTDDTKQNGLKFCSPECRWRAKMLRAGTASSPSAFLAEQVRECERCGEKFTPTKGSQRFCSTVCRKAGRDEKARARRHKTCVHCGEPFVDTSPKNNMRAHPECSRAKWRHKARSRSA